MGSKLKKQHLVQDSDYLDDDLDLEGFDNEYLGADWDDYLESEKSLSARRKIERMRERTFLRSRLDDFSQYADADDW